MKTRFVKILISIVLLILTVQVHAQQFNSDNYLTMPYGTSNQVFTYGARSATILPSLALFPNWEFFLGATLIYEDKVRDAEDHFSTLLMGKWMFFANKDNTGGAAITLGTGGNPAYQAKDQRIDSFRTYFAYFCLTVPLFNNTLSWDVNPGVLLDYDRDVTTDQAAWGFTYSTRLALYKIIPKTAIVGEVYGAMGETHANPEYKIGLRFEYSTKVVPAITYGNSTDGSKGAGIEVGVMIFSPPFL